MTEKTSPLPGLALGCEPQPGDDFKGWEEREKGGALKSMFFWKGHSVSGPPPPLSQPERKKEEKKKPSKLSTFNPPSLIMGCSESIDQAVYKLLTKQRGKSSRQKQKTAFKRDEWRGPREQLSEVPARRKVSNKKGVSSKM